MNPSMYSASVPVFRQMLAALGDVLAKAGAYAEQRKIEPAALLQSRLFPDMLPLVRQVQIASDFAKSVAGRLAGAELPSWEDNEQDFAQLQARIAKTVAFLDSLDSKSFDDSAAREIVLRPGTPKERTFNGQHYLLHYGLPQFFFHVTTAYALLRHNGLDIGKKDYMGQF